MPKRSILRKISFRIMKHPQSREKSHNTTDEAEYDDDSCVIDDSNVLSEQNQTGSNSIDGGSARISPKGTSNHKISSTNSINSEMSFNDEIGSENGILTVCPTLKDTKEMPDKRIKRSVTFTEDVNTCVPHNSYFHDSGLLDLHDQAMHNLVGMSDDDSDLPFYDDCITSPTAKFKREESPTPNDESIVSVDCSCLQNDHASLINSNHKFNEQISLKTKFDQYNIARTNIKIQSEKNLTSETREKTHIDIAGDNSQLNDNRHNTGYQTKEEADICLKNVSFETGFQINNEKYSLLSVNNTASFRRSVSPRPQMAMIAIKSPCIKRKSSNQPIQLKSFHAEYEEDLLTDSIGVPMEVESNKTVWNSSDNVTSYEEGDYNNQR